MDALIKSGMIEEISKLLGGDDDLIQDTYLVVLEKIHKHGNEWLEVKRNEGWLKPYIYSTMRNMIYNKTSPRNRSSHNMVYTNEVPELFCGDAPIDQTLDDKWLLDVVMKFADKKNVGEDGWYEREVMWAWLEVGSWRKLEKLLQRGNNKIHYTSLYNTYKIFIEKLIDFLKENGYKEVQGVYPRFQPI